jgi:hypothetical protein
MSCQNFPERLFDVTPSRFAPFLLDCCTHAPLYTHQQAHLSSFFEGVLYPPQLDDFNVLIQSLSCLS